MAPIQCLKNIARIILLISILHLPKDVDAGTDPIRAIKAHHIQQYYPEQLTNPQKKNRHSLAQFGYNLSYFKVQLFPIREFINPKNFGVHSYSQGSFGEKNGSLYTCRGGFIDFSHMRAAIDWTAYIAFTILSDTEHVNLPPEAGTLKLSFKNIDELNIQDIAELAKKIAFERLAWHEVASWHYHAPYHMRSDQQSTFTPEDSYSNLLGAEIGKRVVLRILNDMDTLPYSEIATEEIQKAIASLDPVENKKEGRIAYDIVDRHVQLKLPEDKRNNDVWWDSNILFRDQRYMFKRNTNIGPNLEPWLVPESSELTCDSDPLPCVLKVPVKTHNGKSFYDYYDFVIDPDTAMFYGRKGEKVHTSFDAFSTCDLDQIVRLISFEMEKIFLAGFNTRDSCDPVQEYKNVRRVGLAVVMSGE